MKAFARHLLKWTLKWIEPNLTWWIDRLAIRAYGGIHPKNIYGLRADLFLERVSPTDVVLDVACGTGALLKRMESRIKQGIGIDLSPGALAPGSLGAGRIEFMQSDILRMDYAKLLQEKGYTVAVFSHILEHLEQPAELLRNVSAARVLICVPSEENWRAKLKLELGVDHRTDPTHFREYTQSRLRADLEQAGYAVTWIGFNSEGEIFCEARRKN